jgi:hypothetical protein
MLNDMKKCTKCGLEKNLNEFYNNATKNDGKDSHCKKCVKERQFINKKQIQNQQKKYYENNKDKIIEKRHNRIAIKRDNIISKICTSCNIEKLLNEFHKSRFGKDGYSSQCKSCRSEYSKKRYENKKEHILNVNKQYVEKNRDKIHKKYEIKKENESEYDKELRRFKHREHARQEKTKKRRAIYRNNRRKNDIKYRLECVLRKRISDIISNERKAGSAIRDLGCSIEELKQHLENKFYPHPDTGEIMSWENYGYYGWHIDHIIPLISFDLMNREQFLKACHYTNLQPLWAKDNYDKKDKLNWEKKIVKIL